jgi:hypothetical protein
MEAGGGMAVMKYSMEAWKQKESWLYTNIEAVGGIAGQKYGSRRTDCCTEILQQWKRDGCAEIRKQEERGLYRNME